MFDLVKGMKARRVPVDAIGLQMHIDVQKPSAADIKTTIELFAPLLFDTKLRANPAF
jgi:endo-1,4-beta-xylanase